MSKQLQKLILSKQLEDGKTEVFFSTFGESFNLESKQLVIYPYSLSHNLLKEVLLKMGLKFVLTNEIKKANLIIGFKKHLKQNFKLTSLAKQKNIPIYALNEVNLYQVTKVVQLIHQLIAE